MDKQTIKTIAQRHADVAVDGDFVADGRDNLIDTLNDDGYADFVADALQAYDEAVALSYKARDRANIY